MKRQRRFERAKDTPEYAPDTPQAEGWPDYAPEQSTEEYAAYDDQGAPLPWDGYEAPPEGWAQEPTLPEKPKKRTIFKPRARKPSFILAVIVNSFRMLVHSVSV